MFGRRFNLSDSNSSVGGMKKSVEVQMTTSGMPLRILADGRVWNVVAQPVRWFERVSWWKSELRMERGSLNRIDVEVWQIQVRLGRNARSEMQTWKLVHEPNTGRYSVTMFEEAA